MLFLSMLLNLVSVENYIQYSQLQTMPTWIYSVKWLIPVIAFTLCFLLLDLVITTSDPKDIYMNCSDVTLRCIKSHLYHVVFISTCNVFYPLYIRFYHCTAYAVHFHCLHVRLLHVTLNINQSVNQLWL